MKTTYLFVTGAAALALALSVAAQDGDYAAPGYTPDNEPPHPVFPELDIDRDGVLSQAEAGGRKGLLSQWVHVDSDGDGVIDRAEFSAFETAYPAAFPSLEGDIPPSEIR